MAIKDNKALFITLQVIGGIVIVLVLYIITLLILNTDSLVVMLNNKVKQNEKIPITIGKSGIMKLSGRTYNTINPLSSNFKKLGKSINDNGGAQFSYQFWMKINDTDSSNYKDLVILLRGDKNKYKKGIYDLATKNLQAMDSTDSEPDYMIKCPLIKFGDSYDNMIIEFNTSKDPSTKMDVKVDTKSRKNLLSLSPLSWYLITYVLEDNFSYVQTSENGVKVTLYINDFPYQSVSASTNPLLKNNYLRQNEGDLHLFPNITQPKDFMQVANMSYYNYALSQKDISSIFEKGPPSFEMKDDASTSDNKPGFISSYNKIDIYNY
jgi:hypothetical protein